MYVAKRLDGTFETLVNGFPYHVTGDDPLFADLAFEYPDLSPGHAEAGGVVTEDHRGKSGWLDGSWFTVKEFGPLPEGFSETPPDAYVRAEEEKKARAESAQILSAYAQRQLVQTEEFTAAEFAVFARAGLFESWTPGTLYAAGKRIAHEGVVYAAQREHTSQAHQPPGSEGMLAVYRPVSADPETGGETDGGPANPHAYKYGMDVHGGGYYAFDGRTYLAKADMLPCVWNPGTAGVWQWELVP